MCSFPGCDGEHVAHGLCSPHLAQQQRGGPLRPLRRARRVQPGSEDACNYPGCDRVGVQRRYLRSDPRVQVAREQLGCLLRRIRETAGVSLEAAAGALGRAGREVAAWEAGRGRVPPRPVLQAYAASIGATGAELAELLELARVDHDRLCRGHYWQLTHLGEDRLRPLWGLRACREPGCSRQARARGLCAWHYARQRRRRMPPCSEPGCDQPVAARGWCDRHYRQWLRAQRGG